MDAPGETAYAGFRLGPAGPLAAGGGLALGDAGGHGRDVDGDGDGGGQAAGKKKGEIETVEVEDERVTCPERFFEEFVGKRKPVVVKGVCPEAARMMDRWTNEELGRLAGGVELRVERRQGAEDSFGKGKKETMTFGSFLDRIEKQESEDFYLTTQDLKVNGAGQQEILGEPLKTIAAKDPAAIALRPKLFGNLITSTANIWMGNARNGSSTGLHHDYHDNLYILLRGKKQFRLFSPADALNLYTRGDILCMHPNGRINYEGFPTRADGSEAGAEEAFRVRQEKYRAECELAVAEKQVEDGVPGAKQRLDAAEERLESVMSQMLDQGGQDDFDDFEQDDYEEQEDDDEQDQEEDEAEKKEEPALKRAKVVEDPHQLPLNFATVDDLDKPNLSRFPRFANAVSETVTLQAGDMLYLPCGWFHEVRSFTASDAAPGRPGHLAFNYWMHPPDTTDFHKPYAHPYWQMDWDSRQPL